MKLTDLPFELLQATFDLLSQQDRKMLRTVCRTIKQSVTVRIPRLFISPNRTNLDVFKNVIAHEELRKAVNEIIWDDARLRNYGEGMEGELYDESRYDDLDGLLRPTPFEKFAEDADGKLWGEEAKEISLEESYHIYQKLYEEQEDIIRREEDLETLRLGLEKMPNVKRVTITSEAWRLVYLFPKYETPFFRSLPPRFRMPLPWPWLGRCSSDGDPGESEMEILADFWEEGPNPEWRGYNIVLRELISTAKYHHVRELVIDVNRELTGICYQLFETLPNEAYSNTLKVFETVPLTRLDLAINVMGAEETGFSCFRNGLLQTALSKLAFLEYFHLHANMPTETPEAADYDENFWALSLNDIFPDPLASTWPNLKHLGLANFFISPDDLYDVLVALPSLETVDLDTLTFPFETGMYRTLLHKIKENLIDPEDGAWKSSKPKITIRMVDGTPTTRITVTNEISKFSYEDGECPFPKEILGFIVHPFGVTLDDFNPLYKMPRKLFFEPGEYEAYLKAAGEDVEEGVEDSG